MSTKAKQLIEQATNTSPKDAVNNMLSINEGYDTLANVVDALCDKIQTYKITFKEIEAASQAFKKYLPKDWKQLDDALRLFINYIN